MDLKRRWFLERSLFAGAGLVLGCSESDPSETGIGGSAGSGGGGQGGAGGGSSQMCDDPFAGGQWLDDQPITDIEETQVPFHQLVGSGWDARLYTDLSLVTRDDPVIGNENFFIRTRYPDLLDPNLVWSVRLHGLVDSELIMGVADLTPLVSDQGVHVLECSGNGDGGAFGLMSAAQWAGVPMTDILGMASIQSGATRVLVEGFDEHSTPSAGGHSTPGAAWIFTLDEISETGAFLATEMNGEELPPDHGRPLRLYVPGWFGCTCIKWVNRIELVDDDAPATSQMQEFASRTHQTAAHALARDYAPANMRQAAMPIRVEKWQVDGAIAYKVVGILWGGQQPVEVLAMQVNGGALEPVTLCPKHSQNQTWTIWEHFWIPPGPGKHTIRMRVVEPMVDQIRLDQGWYDREVTIDEV